VRELQDYGVDCSFARRFDGHTSSLSSVFVDSDGERLIMNHLDPGMPTETGWLPGSLPDGVDAVLADTRWPDGALHMLQTAQQAGVPAVLDGDVPLPVDSRLPEAASHIAFSATGLCEYSDEADPEPGLRKVTDQTGAWCCVTLGSRGTLCCQDGEIVAIPAIAVQPRDTLGAGDVWHGAFSLQLAEGRSALDAARFANAAAAIKVSRSGGRAGAPTRREVEDLVEEISMVHGRVDQI
jgi:sulfofructose kinase